jgi:acetoin utilization deacetylase AcuC-like enzyme
MSPIHTDYHGQDGKAEIVQAASVSLHGPHGQYIENVHLQPYTSDKHFEVLYEGQYSKLLKKAEEFVKGTGGKGDDVLVFIRSVDDYNFCDGLYSLSFCPDVPLKK